MPTTFHLRRVSLLYVSLAALMAVSVGAQQPSVAYPSFAISTGGYDGCYVTAPPLFGGDPGDIYFPIHCVSVTESGIQHASQILHLDLIRQTSSVLWTIATPGVIFRNQPMPLGFAGFQALAYTIDSAASVVGAISPLQNNGNNGPVWSFDRHNATSGIAFDWRQIVFVPIGSHGPVGSTSLRAVFGINGSTYWESFFEPTAQLGTPIWYENRVLIMHDSTLRSFNASSGYNDPRSFSYQEPCGMIAMPGRKLNLALVTYSFDMTGPLMSLLLYGMTVGGNYTVCRIHHGSYRFGQREWLHTGPYNNTIDSVGGGAGFIFLSLLNEQFSTYHVVVLNATTTGTKDALVYFLNRSSIDRASYPSVLYDENGQNPLMLLQLHGQLTAYRLYGDLGMQWQLPNVQCAQQPTVTPLSASVARAICVGHTSGTVVEVDYYGNVVWTYNAGSKVVFPPMDIQETQVLITQALQMTGLSFDAESDSSSGGGASAGVVVLVIFVILFVMVLGAAIWKAVRMRGTRRSARDQTDKEGYAGLNA